MKKYKTQLIKIFKIIQRKKNYKYNYTKRILEMENTIMVLTSALQTLFLT